jgi:hypothetical protein
MRSEQTRAQRIGTALERSRAQVERSDAAIERAAIQVEKADGIEYTEAFLVTARAQIERVREGGFG